MDEIATAIYELRKEIVTLHKEVRALRYCVAKCAAKMELDYVNSVKDDEPLELYEYTKDTVEEAEDETNYNRD